MSDATTGFDPAWLALREPVDHVAREATGLSERLVRWLDARRGDGAPGAPTRVVDLGCGTGSNLRFLLPRLGHDQRWRLVDDDPALLDALPGLVRRWCEARGVEARSDGADGALAVRGARFSATIRTERLDLAANLGALELAGTDLVTAAALLDLCSADWIEALVRACVEARAAALFALDYDGGADWDPPHPDDAILRERVNRHQRRDKGFGPALGPAAGALAARRLGELGHEVIAARSVWRVGPDATALHAAFVDGWARAAREPVSGDAAGPDGGARLGARIDAWSAHRRRAAADGAATLAVGHHDALALPGSCGPGPA